MNLSLLKLISSEEPPVSLSIVRPPLEPVQPLSPPNFPIDLPALLRNLEDQYITAALCQTGGNRTAAAELLGLQRTTLVEKLRRRQAP